MRKFFKEHINIVSFDVPLPANYGGVIDVFYKIKALSTKGIKVHLHCFQYGRKKSKELEKYCEKVHYYQRNMSKHLFLSDLPYIVISRKSDDLINNLLLNEYPILYEGLHSCYSISDDRLKDRFKSVRTHNIEHHYYEGLARVEENFFKRFYFNREQKKLKKFQRILKYADRVFSISPSDTNYFSNLHGHVYYLPAFHPNDEVIIEAKFEDYALYHGNLSVGENSAASIFLVNEVFNGWDRKLIIAGNNPSEELKKLVEKHQNVELKADIDVNSINDLISKARVNVLTTAQSTGIKLKLLAVLFRGGHCVVNSPMVENTGLEHLCVVKDSPNELKEAIADSFNRPFEEQEKRSDFLKANFSNLKVVDTLIENAFYQ